MQNPKQKLLIIGATGFVGKQVYRQLLQRDDVELHCYVRSESVEKLKHTENKATLHTGTLEDSEQLEEVAKKVDGVLYCASLGFDYAKNVVAALEKSGVSRVVFISTTALFTKLNANSKTVRKKAEERILASSLKWTILRPTMIYGLKGDRNMERLVSYIQKYAILPTPGSGKNLQQPVHVRDVASAVIDAYFSEKAVKTAYNISGETSLTFKEVVQTTAQLLQKKTFILPVPLTPCLLLLKAYEACCRTLKLKPKLKAEQLLRLNEDKDFDHTAARKDFGYAPISFKAGMAQLIKDL